MSAIGLLIRRNPKTTARRPKPGAASLRNRYCPLLEDMEERLVLSTPGVAAPIVAQAQVHTAPQATVNVPLTISNINLTGLARDATGVITAVGQLTGTLLGQNFVTNFTTTLTPPAAGQTCPVLDLKLAPIHLSLLGLNVDTSAICLDITATQGGGLLGDLLCGLNLGTIDLSGLNGLLNNTQLLGGLNNLLSQATSQFGSPHVSSSTPGASCNVLDLSLGPVDLSLLGLNVHLDNCANKPVTVDITATPGGGLLGDLLCSLDNVLNNGASVHAADALLANIVRAIGRL